MKNYLLVGAFLTGIFASAASFALNVGEKVRVVRSTQLMTTTTVLATIEKGAEIDVFEIDKKSFQWFLTEIARDGKLIRGWVKIRDVAVMPQACATGYTYYCQDYISQQCKNSCEPPVCSNSTVYECTTNWEYDPIKGEYGYVEKCDYVTKTNCAPPVCHQECWPVTETYCSCKKG